MTSKLKQNIRCQKAAERMLRTIYPSNPIEKKLVQLNEKHEDLSKWSNRVWSNMYAMGFVAGKDNSNPLFFDCFSELSAIEKLQSKVSKSIDIQELKGISLQQALNTMYIINAGKGSASY